MNMIKAVFFDLYQTLVHYDPPREEQLARIISDYGIKIAVDSLRHPIVLADEYIYEEHARFPISKRNEKEQKTLFAQYQTILLEKAGIRPTPELIRHNIIEMQRVKFKHVLFDDVLPVLNKLRQNGTILGLISNIDSDMSTIFDELGLSPLLQVVATSQDTGYHKPQPEIFNEAARRAEVKSSDSLYIGDQYQIDVIGAKESGMQGILLDRNGYFTEFIEELIITNLYQLVDYVLNEKG